MLAERVRQSKVSAGSPRPDDQHDPANHPPAPDFWGAKSSGSLGFQQRHLAQAFQLVLNLACVANHDDNEVFGVDVAVGDA